MGSPEGAKYDRTRRSPVDKHRTISSPERAVFISIRNLNNNRTQMTQIEQIKTDKKIRSNYQKPLSFVCYL
jgi:hypothetical protein